MHVIIAKVDEVFFEGEAGSVTAPGAEGEMTLLPRHMPLITTLKKGIITVRDVKPSEGVHKFPVTGGILEVDRYGVTVIL